MKELNTFLRNTIQNKDPYSAQHYYQLMTRIGQKSPKALQILKKQRKLLQRAGGCGASTPHKKIIPPMAPAPAPATGLPSPSPSPAPAPPPLTTPSPSPASALPPFPLHPPHPLTAPSPPAFAPPFCSSFCSSSCSCFCSSFCSYFWKEKKQKQDHEEEKAINVFSHCLNEEKLYNIIFYHKYRYL